MDLSRPKLKQEIERLVRYWIPILGLSHWSLTLTFRERANLAACSADPEYEQAVLSFSLKRIQKELTPEQLEEVIVHELCHCLTWYAANTPKKLTSIEEEQLNTRVERAVMRAYRTGLDKPTPTS